MTLKEKIYEIIKDLQGQEIKILKNPLHPKENFLQGELNVLELCIGLLKIALREAEREEK